jgi:hypothetical protein
MMNLSRDSWLAIGLLLSLIVITGLAALQRTQEVAPPLASFSAAPDGAKALRLWLEALGYELPEPVVSSFVPPLETDLILLLEPSVGITPEEWQVLDAWVEQGGQLTIVGQDFNAALAFRHYDFNLRYTTPITSAQVVQTPLWTAPPIDPAQVETDAFFVTNRQDFVTHLALAGDPVIVSFKEAQGQVLLSAAAFPFSNAGLKEPGNPALVLNVVGAAGEGASIWFDEWHHGVRTQTAEIVGPFNWLRFTPAGRSLLFVATVILVGLALRGRHFGRPVPLPNTLARRAPLEYITAIANLSRRAEHRPAMLEHYRQRLKRALGRRYGLNPTLPDAEYLAHLSQANPDFETDGLRELLAQLRRQQISENELVRLAAEVTTFLKE